MRYTLKKLTPALFLSLSVGSLLAGCDSQPEQQAQQMHPASVSTQQVTPQSVPFAIELPATLSGSREVEIRARVSGILESRNFEEGDRVEAGKSLFTLELESFQLEVERGEADLAAAKARVLQANREVKRLGPLRNQNSVSQRDYDNALSALDIAKADQQGAEARLKEAQLNLQYAKVTSPINGVAGREFVSEGTYVSGPDLLLTQVTQLDPIRVRFGLSEREQLQMRKDAKAGLLTLPENGQWRTQVKMQDGSLYQHPGEVNFSDVRINPNTGTSEFQAIVPNPELQLRPGQFVRVVLEGASREQAFVVPQRAVLDGGTGKYVYLMVPGENGMTIAQPAPVEVGEWVRLDTDEGMVNAWVIRSGLKAGDKVVVDGMARIFFPGMPIVEGQPQGASAH